MIKTPFIIIINFILCRSDGNRVVAMVGVEIIHLNKNSKNKKRKDLLECSSSSSFVNNVIEERENKPGKEMK